MKPARLLWLWNSPGKNTGVGSLSLLQEIFPTQRLNPSLLHCRRILYPQRHQGSPNLFIVGQREREKECVCVCVGVKSCAALCNPMDCSLPGSSNQRIFQASILEWVAISYSRGYFLIQESNPCLWHLLHWQVDSFPAAPSGKPKNSSDSVARRPEILII